MNETTPDLFSMSDEDFSKLSFDAFLATTGSDESQENTSTDTEEEFEQDTNEEEESSEDTEQSDNEEEVDSENTEEESEESESESDEEVDSDKTEDNTNVTEYGDVSKLFKPIKAAGKEIQLNNVDEVLSLVQMGADYTRKMQMLKPKLRIQSLLEKNGISTEAEVNFLLDLHRKDPKAISKLVKESNVRDLDIDDLAESYVPSTDSIRDSQVDFDLVRADLKSRPNSKYDELINHVAKFDDESKQLLMNRPQALTELYEHLEVGLFDKVMAEVDKRRMFNLQGAAYKPLFQLYVEVGNELAQKEQSSQTKQAAKASVKGKTVATKSVPPKVSNKQVKNAAPSGAKGLPKETNLDNQNFLDMSDEEFEALEKSMKAFNRGR